MMPMKLLNVMAVELLFMKVRKFVTTFYTCVYFIIIFCLFSVYAYLTNVMPVDALFFPKVAMEYLTQQVYPALYRHVQQNRGFVKHVELELQILHVNYVQIQVTSLFCMRSGA